MSSLPTEFRKQLESAIKGARRVSELGARRALEALAVDRREAHGSMSPDERALRNRLRAHGRQLGDVRDRARGTQEIDRLAHEVAYEYWHRMLFARFLAENQLLIEPESGVAISMAECEELAREQSEDPWALAARAASRMLPRIFRPDDPALEVTLAPETRQTLERLLESLPAAVFTADDSLGWTYQFWQAERKKQVNESGVKIGADELPAVTQLFTEHYMVLFLFHNTIGAWRAGKLLAEHPELAEKASSEEELRRAVRLEAEGGYDFTYLRFVREPREGDEDGKPTGPWRPAAGTFEGWPKTAKELKVLDPCCGSGHFLVEGFELLVRLRMDEEGIDLEDAIHGVLADNLHGLELDPRCTQIAAFNLAMAAWKLAGRSIELPAMHIACSGLAVGSTKNEWTTLAGDAERLRAGMERLYNLFEQAPELGSLIDPKALKGDMFEADFCELQPLLEQALERESDDVEDTERAVAAQGMARAAELLSGEYTLAITNVPYLLLGKQPGVLQAACKRYYAPGAADLATVFLERCSRLCHCGGTHATVTPQNWLFLGAYKRLRRDLLTRQTVSHITKIGSGATSTKSWDVLRSLAIVNIDKPHHDYPMTGLEALDPTDIVRAAWLRSGDVLRSLQSVQLTNPDSRVSLRLRSQLPLLSETAAGCHGQGTRDSNRFMLKWWELREIDDSWEFLQTTVSETTGAGGAHGVVLWEHGHGQLARQIQGYAEEGSSSPDWNAGLQCWGREGVLITQTRNLAATRYLGRSFDSNCAVVMPSRLEDTTAVWCYCASPEYSRAVRGVDQKLNVTNATLVKVPFDLEYWKRIAAEKYPNGLPEPQSDHPTQWLFHGHPAKAETATVLQVAVGRLLGYQWPPELDPEMRLADEAREWVTRCDALKEFADEDGIVCLAATRGERSAADRLRELLSAAFGAGWSNAKERELLAAAAAGTNPAASLDVWLRDKFFEEHCKLFHHRPFVWHIWDGNMDGFHCLVNAHKLTGRDGAGRRTLQAITFSYLNDWIDRQKADQHGGKEGADARLAAAQDLQGQLEKILEGEPPYDLFVRWKPLHEQATGWEPDINDGVRFNIRPFMKAELRKGGKKGAGILRWRPNVQWKKDRGKEPRSLRPKEDFPWFWSCPGDGTPADRTDFTGGPDFDGNRWNDLHYTRAAKHAARERATEEDER